jgi:PAS domain S-box-containing protein/putative nucleotidyltransferase with HDIG domain
MILNGDYYGELIRALPDIVYRLDSKGNFTFLNDSISYLGYTPEQLLGEHFTNIIHPDDIKQIQRSKVLPGYRGKKTAPGAPLLFDERRTGNRITRKLNVRLIKKIIDREIAYTEGEVIAIGLYSDNGKGRTFIGTIGLIRDINEIKSVTRALSLTEKHYKLLMENISEIISIIAHDGTILYGSDSIPRILGYSSIDLIGENIFKFIHPDDRDTFQASLKEKSESRIPGHIEYRFKDSNGSWRLFESSLKEILDNKNKPMCFILNSRDISYWRQSTDELENEKKYRQVIENTFDIVYRTDAEGKIIDINEAFQQEIGYNREDIIGSSFEMMLYPDDVPVALEAFEMSEQEEFAKFEIRVKKKDGSTDWYSFINLPVIGENGALESFHGIATNITARKETEEALRESEEKFSNAFHSSPIPMTINTLKEGRYIDVNESAIKLTGYSREEFIDSTAFDLSIFSDKETHSRFVNALKEDGRVSDFEYEFKLKSGEINTGIASAEKIIIKGEYCVLTSTVNITECKRAEKALRESEERYRHLIENANDIIYWTDHEGYFTFINPVVQRIMGYHENELIGKHYLELIHPDYREEAERFYGLQFVKKISSTYYEIPANTKEGKELWIGQNVQLVIEDDQVSGFRAVVRDITDQRHANEKITSTIDKLRKAMNGIIQAIELTVETRDLYTAGHQRRVSNIARAIATEMDLPKNIIDGIRIAGLLHDLGKMHVPAEILSKPGKITENEFNIIKSHSKVGYDILKNIEFPWPIDRIVHQHHERIDGSGYPDGITGEGILIEARILAVADVVEAMSSHRPYRAATGIDSALSEIENNRGTLYDPEVVDACIRIFKEKSFQLDRNAEGEKIDIEEDLER